MISVCMFTSPRKTRLIEKSIKYLRLANLNEKIYIFSEPQDKFYIENTEVHYNEEKLGLVVNWRESLKKLSEISKDEWFLILEDDIECKYDSYLLLKNFASTINYKIGAINGYLPKSYSISNPELKRFNGWAKINRGWDNWGTQCVLIQRETAMDFINSERMINAVKGTHNIDNILGEYTLSKNLDFFYSCPSLFEHSGMNHSCVGGVNEYNCAYRYNENFSGKKILKKSNIIF